MTTEPEDETVRALRAVVHVKRAELVPLLASTAWLFFALASYYVLKPIRSVVLQTRIGVDRKGVALLLTTVFVALLVHLYGRFVPRVSRPRLVTGSFVGFIVSLVGFALVLEGTSASWLGYAFYVWVSTFNVLVVSQFWSVASDVWAHEEATRLFGFIGVGAVLGSVVGNLLSVSLARHLSMAAMLGVAGTLLAMCLGLSRWLLGWASGRSVPGSFESQTPEPPRAEYSGAAALVAASPYLTGIAAMTLVLNVVNTSNEWVLDKVVAFHAQNSGDLRRFYARYLLEQNLATIAIQAFATTRIQRRFGVRTALLVLPSVSAIGGLVFLAAPTLSVARMLKIGENAADYSIHANTRELLYVPLTQLEKYSAKSFNDTFVVRAGDSLAAAAIVVLGTLFGRNSNRALPWLVAGSVALSLVGALAAARVGAAHRSRTQPPK